jgi:hypothetical protein
MPKRLVKEEACITIKSPPDPEFVPFFAKVPHLVDFEDNRLPTGDGFLSVVGGVPPDPFQHRARTNAEHLSQCIDGDAGTIEEHGQQ